MRASNREHATKWYFYEVALAGTTKANQRQQPLAHILSTNSPMHDQSRVGGRRSVTLGSQSGNSSMSGS